MSIVTTFDESYYQRCGKDFLDTYRQFWPKSIPLTIYYEGDELGKDEENITWRYMEEVQYLSHFLETVSRFPFMMGIIGDNRYNIQYDARMCRAAFIQAHHMKHGGKVLWLDADIVTHSPVPENFIDTLLPDDKLCAYLGRDWWYTETGGLCINADHPAAESFRKLWIEVFNSGVIFSLQGWHDCYGFDLAKKAFGHPELFVDLIEQLKPQRVFHPFVNSIFGAYMDHRKGNRKESRSTRNDLVIERQEPYWQENG